MKKQSSDKKIRINFRITRSQFLKLKTGADSANLPLSKFLRFEIFDTADHEISNKYAVKERQAIATFNDKLNDLERKYKGIGENLNQVMKQCYIYGLDKEHDRLLFRVNEAIKEVHQLDNDVQNLKK